MRTKTERFEVLIPTIDGKEIAERITIEVVEEWDEEIGAWLLTPGSLRKIDDTKARHMGLLLPDEIKAIRERLGLTQAAIAHALGIGEKTLSRWESGRHRQSHSMDLLLRLFEEHCLESTILYDCGTSRRKPSWAGLSHLFEQNKPINRTPNTPGCPYDKHAPNYAADENDIATKLKQVAA